MVLASSGLRASEARAIRLCDVDFMTQPTRIHVRKEYAKTINESKTIYNAFFARKRLTFLLYIQGRPIQAYIVFFILEKSYQPGFRIEHLLKVNFLDLIEKLNSTILVIIL